MGTQVKLVPMTEAEFAVYEQAEAEEYAGENVRAGYWAEDEAAERARKSHRLLLPHGAATAGHHFCRRRHGSGKRGDLVVLTGRRARAS
jgi:hypothetical protein